MSTHAIDDANTSQNTVRLTCPRTQSPGASVNPNEMELSLAALPFVSLEVTSNVTAMQGSFYFYRP